MKQINVHKSVKLAKRTPLRGDPICGRGVGTCRVTCCPIGITLNWLPSPRGLDPPQKLFLHGQPSYHASKGISHQYHASSFLRFFVSSFANCQLPTANRLRSFAANNRNDAVPKNLFALNPIICYNQIMSDLNFEPNNHDLVKPSIDAKTYKEKISHAIL
jgi:hypothetical protein